MKPIIEQKIQQLEADKRMLLCEVDVLWDEVHAVERDLIFLKGISGFQSEQVSSFIHPKDIPEKLTDQPSDPPYAAEDAAVVMMESAAKKGPC